MLFGCGYCLQDGGDHALIRLSSSYQIVGGVCCLAIGQCRLVFRERAVERGVIAGCTGINGGVRVNGGLSVILRNLTIASLSARISLEQHIERAVKGVLEGNILAEGYKHLAQERV